MKRTFDKAWHLTVIPLRSIAEERICCYKNQVSYKRGNTVIHILKTLCKIKIARVPQPVFFRGSNGVKDFYIHAGNATRMLDSIETQEYIQMHLEARYSQCTKTIYHFSPSKILKGQTYKLFYFYPQILSKIFFFVLYTLSPLSNQYITATTTIHSEQKCKVMYCCIPIYADARI